MTKIEFKEVMEDVIDAKLKEFWVDREVHYQHHSFIDRWMKWCDKVSTTTLQTIVRATVLAVLALISLGFFVRFIK